MADSARGPHRAGCVLRKAPPLPFLPRGVARPRDPRPGHGLRRRRRGGETAAARPLREYGKPIADVVGADPVRRVPEGVRPAAHAGRAELLEVAQLHRAPRRGDRHVPRPRRAPALAAVRDLHGQPRRSGRPGARLGHGLPAPGRQLRPERARPLGDAGRTTRACTAWARGVFDSMAPYATGGVYVNFMSEDEDRVGAAYGANYDRLARAEEALRPHNLFRVNQNVTRPGAQPRRRRSLRLPPAAAAYDPVRVPGLVRGRREEEDGVRTPRAPVAACRC